MPSTNHTRQPRDGFLYGPYRSDSRVAQTVAEVVGLLVLAALVVGVLFLIGAPTS